MEAFPLHGDMDGGRFLLAEFIYTMRKARKAHGDKVILDDVTLSFLPGREDRRRRAQRRRQVDRAQDHGRAGPAVQRRRVPVARLHRRHPAAGAAARRVQGRARQRRGGRRRDQGASSTGSTRSPSRWRPTTATSCWPRWASCRRRSTTRNAWDLDSQLEQAMDALRCPPPDADVTVLSGGERRRVALCKLLLQQPDLLLLDEPTNHLDAESVQWLEQHLEKYPGTVVAVTHDRYFLDNVAQWILELDRGRAYPYEGNYSTYLETKAAAPEGRGPEGRQAREAAQGRAGVGALQRQGRARPRARRASSATRRWPPRRTRPASWTSRRSRSRRARGWAASSSRPTSSTKGFGDRLLIDDLSFTLPRNGIVGDHRPQRRRQDHAVQDDHRRGAARRRRAQDRRDGQDLLRRPEPRPASTRRRRCGRSSPTASTTSRSATSRCRPGPTCRRSASRARTSRSRPGCCPAASATGSTSR